MLVTLMSIGRNSVKVVLALGALKHPTGQRVCGHDLRRFDKVRFVYVGWIFFGVQIITLTIIFSIVLTVAVLPIERIAKPSVLTANALPTPITNVVANFEKAQTATVTPFSFSVVLTVNANSPWFGDSFSNFTAQLAPKVRLGCIVCKWFFEKVFAEASVWMHMAVLFTVSTSSIVSWIANKERLTFAALRTHSVVLAFEAVIEISRRATVSVAVALYLKILVFTVILKDCLPCTWASNHFQYNLEKNKKNLFVYNILEINVVTKIAFAYVWLHANPMYAALNTNWPTHIIFNQNVFRFAAAHKSVLKVNTILGDWVASVMPVSAFIF